MLQETVIPISFAQGLNTKTDPKQISAGQLLTLENGVFTTPGEIIKRNGYLSLSDEIYDNVSPTTLIKGSSLGLLNDNLVLTDNTNVFIYLPEKASWAKSGYKTNLRLSTKSLAGTTGTSSYPSSVSRINNFKFVAYPDLLVTSSLRYYLSDYITNVPVTGTTISAVTTPGTIVNIQTLSLNTEFGATVRSDDGTTSTTTIGTVQITGGTHNFSLTINDNRLAPPMVPVFNGTNLFLLYTAGGGNDLVIDKYALGGAGSLTFVSTVTVTTTDITLGTEILVDLINSELVVLYTKAGVNVVGKRYDYNLTLLATFAASSDVGDAKVTGALNGTDLGVFFERQSSDTVNYFTMNAVVQNYRTSPSVFSLVAKPTYNTRLYSNAFVQDSRYYYSVIHLKQAQATQFIISVGAPYSGGPGVTAVESTVAGKFALNTAYYGSNLQGLVKWSNFQLPYFKAAQTSLASGAIVSQFVISELTTLFDEKLLNVSLANNLTFVGGILSIFDGLGVAEAGFNLFPEIIAASTNTPGSTDTYSYLVVYSWIDFQGNLHRSAPSIPSQVQTATPIGLTGVTGTIISTGLGVSEVYKAMDVTVDLYRTTNGGTVYYLTQRAANNLVGSVSFTDNSQDSVIIQNQQLYTTGGELENIGPPTTNLITSFKNRIISVDAENPLQWWFSKQVIQGFPAEFSDLLTQNIDEKGGNITALNTMDDKLIFFKASNIWYVIGDGPAPNGQSNDFSYPQIISSDTGCINQSSILLTPAGLFFQSPKGIYLLQRDLSLSYIGAAVERYNSANVTSAQMIAGTTQIRLSLNTGIVLVYDYFVKQWSIFTNINASDAVIYLGNYTYLTSTGMTNVETPGVYADPSATPISLKLTTGWMSFAGIQNFQRVKQFLVLGESESATNLSVSLAYNFDSTITQVDNISIAGSQIPMQYRVFTQLQKCESIQLTLQDSPVSTTEGLRLSALAFNVAQKKGPFKMPASSTYG
jgi:hypothetical protein